MCRAPVKPSLRQVGGGQAIGRGLGGMQLLGIGRIAQELPQPCGLRAGRAQRMEHLLSVQAEQAAHRDGGGDECRPCRWCGKSVVRAAQEFADADADFVAGDRRREQVRPERRQRLGDGERGREDDGGGMENRAVMHVVLLEHMGCRRIDHGGEQRGWCRVRETRISAAPSAGPMASARIARWLATARAPRPASAEPAQSSEQVFGAAQHRLRDVLEAQAGGKSRELGAVAAGRWCAS